MTTIIHNILICNFWVSIKIILYQLWVKIIQSNVLGQIRAKRERGKKIGVYF